MRVDMGEFLPDTYPCEDAVRKDSGMPHTKRTQSKSPSPSASQPRGVAESTRASAEKASSFEATLFRVMQLAQRLAQDTRETRRNLPSGRSRDGEASSGRSAESQKTLAREELLAALKALDPETALKLRTLMIAGRDGQSLGSVNVNVSLSDSEAGFAAMAADSGDNGPLLVDYLRRGHAIACAAGIQLEEPLAQWQPREPRDLDARAWVSFGKQLANSTPSDWNCFGAVDAGTGKLGKLYVQIGDRAWWSFQAVLDRPTLAGVEKERRALTKRRLKALSPSNVDAFVAELGGLQGRALQRAGRAICARVGQSHAAAR